MQQNVIGKIRFGLEANGHTYGTINAENWRAWNFRVEDHTGDGGRPHHQDLGGPGQDDVHHRRQLRGADPPAARGAAALPRGRQQPSPSTPPSSRTTGRLIVADAARWRLRALDVPIRSGRGPRRRRAGAGGGPDAARRPHVGAAARGAPRASRTSCRAATACWRAPPAPPRPSPSSTRRSRSRGRPPTATPSPPGPSIGTVVRAAGVGAHRRADGAELPLPPLGHRHDHPPVRRGGRRRAARPGSGTRARPRRGCARSRRRRCGPGER